MWKRKHGFLIIMPVICMILFTGCIKIRFTAGISDFAKCGKEAISTEMADLLFSEQKYIFENTFNNSVWTENIGDITVREYVTESVKDTASHLIYLNLMADDMQIMLTDEDERKAVQAAEEYSLLIGKDNSFNTVYDFYTALRRAEKTFYAITEGVNSEVSNDEARIISVQYIFISTMYEDEDGNIREASDEEEKLAALTAGRILDEIRNGADMITTAKEKSSDKICSMELGRGEYIKEFEDAAFNLEIGEVSGVVKTEYGYYIIKCINDNIESGLETRRQEIILGRRMEIFAGEYEKFISGRDIMFNKQYLDKDNINDSVHGTGRLYKIYKKYFC